MQFEAEEDIPLQFINPSLIQEPIPQSQDSAGSSSSEEEVVDESPHCFCRKPDDGRFMLQCENCNIWFHGKCVGMTKEKAKRLKSWLCYDCAPKTLSSLIIDNTNNRYLRRSSQETDAPPLTAKRQKLSHHPSVKAASALDQVRKRVLDNLAKVLQMALTAIRETNKFDDGALPGDEQTEKLAENIEAEMFQQFGSSESDQYKEKFRSLHFNLKNAQNAYNVFSGKISPQNLVKMSPEALASENLRVLKTEIHEKSLANSVLTETMANVILKKTHKGMVEFKNDGVETVTATDPMDSMINLPAAIPVAPVEVEAPAVPTVTDEEMASNFIDLSSAETVDRMDLAASPVEPSASAPETPVETVTITDQVSSTPISLPPVVAPAAVPAVTGYLEELLNKARNSKTARVSLASSVPVSAAISESDSAVSPHVEQNEAETEKTVASRAFPSFLLEKAVAWHGDIEMAGVGKFVGQGKLCASAGLDPADFKFPNFQEHLGLSLEINGRISHDSSHAYLDMQIYSDIKSIAALVIEPTDNWSDYENLWKYFTSRSRYAVVKSRSSRIKDMYLLPIRHDQQLPDFFDGMQGSQNISRDREYDIMVLVVVYNTVAADAPLPPSNVAAVQKAPVQTLEQSVDNFLGSVFNPQPSPAPIYSQPVSAYPHERPPVQAWPQVLTPTQQLLQRLQGLPPQLLQPLSPNTSYPPQDSHQLQQPPTLYPPPDRYQPRQHVNRQASFSPPPSQAPDPRQPVQDPRRRSSQQFQSAPDQRQDYSRSDDNRRRSRF